MTKPLDTIYNIRSVIFHQANSVVISEVDAPAWLHRFIIGRQGSNVRKITQEFPNVHIEFTEGQEKIIVEGPPEQVEQAQNKLEEITKDLLARMAFAEIEINQKYHRHIIGKQGSNGECVFPVRICYPCIILKQ